MFAFFDFIRPILYLLFDCKPTKIVLANQN